MSVSWLALGPQVAAGAVDALDFDAKIHKCRRIFLRRLNNIPVLVYCLRDNKSGNAMAIQTA
jgi:hypothetical protein